MARETLTAKAARYLADGALTVLRLDPLAELVEAEVRGDTGEYHLGHTPDRGWWCSCPARRRCAHLEAAELVATRRREVEHVS